MNVSHRAAVVCRPFACVVALAAVGISVAQAQCLPASQMTLITGSGVHTSTYTGTAVVSGTSSLATEKVCAVLACPVSHENVYLNHVEIERSSGITSSALAAVEWKPAADWVPLHINIQPNSAGTALVSQAGGMVGVSLGNEAQVEFSIVSGTDDTTVTVVLDCVPGAVIVDAAEFPMPTYVIAAHFIPLILLILIIIVMLLGAYHAGVRAQFIKWGWCQEVGAQPNFEPIKDRAGGAMWYDHATEVVNDLNQQKIYETAARDENQSLDEIVDPNDDAAVHALL